MSSYDSIESVRSPAVASLFYPGNPSELQQNVRELLDGASQDVVLPDDRILRALIVPHAGYVYSGSTAAKAYRLLKNFRDVFRRIVLLGPAHRVWIQGIAFSAFEAFDSPLGRIPLAVKQIQELLRFPEVQLRDDAHLEEHCLEVQLPFLQELLGDFDLIPAVVGETSAEIFSEILETLLQDPNSLLLLSTDLSHFLSYSQAREMDSNTARAIELFEEKKILTDQACGAHPLRGLLRFARNRNWDIQRLGLCNSGDTAGSKDRVVGYGAWVFTEKLA